MANSKGACTNCKKRFPREQLKQVPAGKFCSTNCLYSYANDKRNKSRLVSVGRKEFSKVSRESKRKNLNWQHDQTQPVFNKMRRLEELLWFQERGLQPTCISCGNPLGGDQWCCGHYKTQGGNSRLRYDRKNTYLQHNVRCNRHLSGDIAGTSTTHGYEQGLINRFGLVEANKIIAYCEANTGAKIWTCEEVEQLRKEFNQRIRDLEKELAA